MWLSNFSGPVWRLIVEGLTHRPTDPVTTPEGRFHHSAQIAVYASLTAEGASVAIKRYLADNQARWLIPMWLDARLVADVRDDPGASKVWQDERARGEIASTWTISDAARKDGAQAMLYSSRSRPDLAHVVVFDTESLQLVGPITRWQSSYPDA